MIRDILLIPVLWLGTGIVNLCGYFGNLFINIKKPTMRNIWYYIMWWRYHKQWDRYLCSPISSAASFIVEALLIIWALIVIYDILKVVIKEVI
jgi:hypothetical protein